MEESPLSFLSESQTNTMPSSPPPSESLQKNVDISSNHDMFQRDRNRDTTPSLASTAFIKRYDRSLDAHTLKYLLHSLEFLGEGNKMSFYNSILSLVSKSSSDTEKIHVILKEMERRNLHPNASTFDSILWPLAKRGFNSLARHIFANMHDFNVVPQISHWNALLFAESERGASNSAMNIFELIKDHDVTPNSQTFTLLIRSFIKNENISQAITFLDTIPKYNTKPTLYDYYEIANYLSQSGNSDEIQMLFQSMNDKDKLQLNEIGYGILLKSVSKSHDTETCFSIFNHMMKKGMMPNAIMLDIFIRMACRNGKQECIDQFFDTIPTSETEKLVDDMNYFHELQKTTTAAARRKESSHYIAN